jgi:hypothetical protein
MGPWHLDLFFGRSIWIVDRSLDSIDLQTDFCSGDSEKVSGDSCKVFLRRLAERENRAQTPSSSSVLPKKRSWRLKMQSGSRRKFMFLTFSRFLACR